MAVFALIISNIIWGAAPPIFKLALTNIPPFSLAFLRFGIATILLLPFLYRLDYWKVNKRDWLLFLQNALYGVTFNISFFFLGLRLAPSINASIIAAASSIFTTLLAVIFISEKPALKTLFGNLIGFIGVLIIILSPLSNYQININKGELIGNIFLVLATLSAAAQAVTSRKLALKYRSRTFTFYSFLIGATSFFPFALMELFSNPSWPLYLDLRGISGLIFGAVFSSFIAYSIWGYAAEKITASEIGLYMYINPVITVLIAIPLLGEKITFPFIIGTVLAILGIYVAERRVPYLPIHHKTKL